MRSVFALMLLLALPRVGAADGLSGPVDLVAELYHEYAWEAVIGAPVTRERFDGAPRETLERYLTPALAASLVADRERSERSGQVGALDFAPLWFSQVATATGLEVAATGREDEVRVSYQVPGSNERIEMRHRLTRTPAGWRIADIEYDEGLSLARILDSSASDAGSD
jgi:hypothetical protein